MSQTRDAGTVRRLIGPFVFATALVGLLSGVVLAHAEIDTASPGPDSVVESRPEALVVAFTEPVDPAKTSIEVRDPGGAVVAKGGAADIAANGLTMSVPLPALSNGAYEVRWTTAAPDGHIERGTYTFTVALPQSPSPSASPSPSVAVSPSSAAPNPSATPSVSAPPDEGPAGDVGGSVLVPLLAVAVVVAALGAWFVRRRRT